MAALKIKESLSHITLLIVRLGSSALMLTHGWPKALKLFEDGEIKFADPFGLGVTFTLTLAVFAEVVCAALVAVGLKTRLAALPLLITMVAAGFIIHAGDPIATREKAFLYILVYLIILVKGAGKYSIDYLVFGKK